MAKVIEVPVSYSRKVMVDDSTNIHRIDYDPIRHFMKVKFTNNRTYLYKDVTNVAFGTIIAASSCGEAFNEMKKRFKWPYEEVK